MAITLTRSAADHVARFIQKRGKGVGIRLGVKTSGCSGMAYKLEFADETVPEEMLAAFDDTAGMPLARRLLGALAASVIGGVLIALAASGPDTASVEAPPEPARRTATSAGTPTDAAPPLADYAASARSEKGDAAPVLFAPAGGFIAVSREPAAEATPKRPEEPTLRDARSDGSHSAPSIPDPREDPTPAEPTMARSEARDGASPRRSLPAAPTPMTTPDR